MTQPDLRPTGGTPNRLVLFDFDGTLADTAPDLAAAANRQRLRQGLDALPYASLRPHASHGARGLLQAALALTPEDARYDAVQRQFLEDYARGMLEQTRLFAGIAAVLQQLQAAATPWGIVTNKSEALARPIAHHLGLMAHCAVLVGGDTTAYHKPHPGPLLHAAQRVGVAPQRCLYIGDDARDIEAGRAAGMVTIAAAYGYCEDDPSRWGADAVARQPQALEVLISNWAASH